MVRTARALVGPSARAEAVEAARQAQARAAQAEGRAVQLTESRTAAVVAADEERRRIERACTTAPSSDWSPSASSSVCPPPGDEPPEAAAALGLAHREVKETLAELRDLVRGIHPAVLTDRGLDAALSASRPAAPSRSCRRPRRSRCRASTAAQAAAYFVVAEALTNVAKHAGDRRSPCRRASPRPARLRLGSPTTAAGERQRRPAAGSTACAAASPPWTARSTWTARPEPAPD